MREELNNIKDELSQKKAQIFDVREEDEWDEGHLKEAHFVPLSDLRVGVEPDDKNLNIKTYLYCRSGQRVHMAKPLLEEMGFENIVALNEGFIELADNGFEVE
ncbi:MAG: hypothetical protein COA79_13535 [Planctomycetota bacterium]|nr:MAG: hypothetical protein COA79_13535 [Planctomycetota bacterium]